MPDYIEAGLTTAQVEESAARHGTNALTQRTRTSFARRYLASFGDPIIRILMVALGVNLLLLVRDANWYESAGIALAVLLATLISTLSEYGSEATFEKLQEEAAATQCRVRRNHALLQLPVSALVAGDIVHLQAGEKIPADGEMVWGQIAVDQSALNGETLEARKVPKAQPIGGVSNASRLKVDSPFLSSCDVFRGAVVCSGEGIMRVSAVGDATFYGRLATDIQEATVDSPLKTRLARLATLISRFGYGAAAIVFVANMFNALVLENHLAYGNYTLLLQDFMTALTLAITVIVMAVPEGLPMMITLVLSANMRRMLKDNVLVRKLVGIETSGSLNILFTDKTGTLTQGRLSVTAMIGAGGQLLSTAQLPRHEALYNRVLLNCFYNNSANVTTQKLRPVAVGGNSTDRALLEMILPDVHRLPLYAKGFAQPFDSREKFMATEIVGAGGGRVGRLDTRHGQYSDCTVLVKGAPEVLLPACVAALDERGVSTPLTHEALARIKQALQSQAREGVRLLALCETATPLVNNRAPHPPTHGMHPSPITLGNTPQPTPLVLVGIFCIRDELRPDAAAAIREVTEAGVQVVMVTGDNRETAASIARQLQLVTHSNQLITSAELQTLSDDEVKARLPHLRVVARALPSDKGRLVRIAQEIGLVAGMTGDGVNDAPALKRADVGFAMGDGTEIAKEAGDIVILNNSFAGIVRAILYGRTIFKSIRKFLIFQLTINLCAVGISVIGPFIGVEAPVTVIQMLWINMIMDTLAGLAFAGEPPLPEYMRERPKARDIPIINRYMFSQILVTGAFIAALGLAFFTLPFFADFYRNDPRYLQTAFFGLFVFAGVFNALNARTTRLNLFANLTRNRLFIVVMSAVVVMQLFLIYRGGTVFRTTGLRRDELLLVIGLASLVIGCDLLRKLVLRLKGRVGHI
ncbi:MAG: calcium-translocating P-type ATPase, PMCA-type [Defluviitaleaceae bacterium]|nr:calcium-translocating P-type ATPase, PMCA-type [Defluviitaleaceae bacterium]